MGAVRLWSLSFLRRRARSIVGLVLLIGLGAGFSLTAAGSTSVATVTAALLVAVVVAVLPARAATRLRPAHILRSE